MRRRNHDSIRPYNRLTHQWVNPHCLSALVAILALALLSSPTSAEPIPIDDLFRAIHRAGIELREGMDREAVLVRLNQAIVDNPDSRYADLARRLATDLALSIERAAAHATLRASDKPPPLDLMDTRCPTHLLWFSENWKRLAPQFRDKHPDDPILPVVFADRRIISELIPLLSDTSPTRSYGGAWMSGSLPIVPRACDLALLAIQYYSKCRFHFNASTAQLFHQLPQEERDKLIAHIAEWWQANRDKSVADGIRAQLLHADFYAKVWMALNLARLDEDGAGEHRAEALAILKVLYEKPMPGHLRAHLVQALAELKDLSAIDRIHAEWTASLERPRVEYDSGVAYYLLEYGTRREWELLCRIAEKEIAEGRAPGSAPVSHALVASPKSRTSPLAIPGLGLALVVAKVTDSGDIQETDTRPMSLPGQATQYLQALTGLDFGFVPSGSDEERAVAIRRAREWWLAEGRDKYTFDYIEAMMAEPQTEAAPNTRKLPAAGTAETRPDDH